MDRVQTLAVNIHNALGRGHTVILHFDRTSETTGQLSVELNTLGINGREPILERTNVSIPETNNLRTLRLVIRRSYQSLNLSPWPDPLTEINNGIEFYGTSRSSDGVISLGPGDTTLDQLLPHIESVIDPFELFVALADFAHQLFEDGKREKRRDIQRNPSGLR